MILETIFAILAILCFAYALKISIESYTGPEIIVLKEPVEERDMTIVSPIDQPNGSSIKRVLQVRTQQIHTHRD
jgi:hypothetical protein